VTKRERGLILGLNLRELLATPLAEAAPKDGVEVAQRLLVADENLKSPTYL